jgi:hypothetical protein
MNTNSFELKGRRFEIPMGVTGIAAEQDQRLVAGITVANSREYGGDDYIFDLSPGAIDLSLVSRGQCPLLLEHCRTFENLLGRVRDAWVDGPALMAVAQLAPGAWSDRAWALLQDGMPLSVSTGSSIQDAELIGENPSGGKRYQVTRWALTELSVVVFGRDPEARLNRLDNSPEARAKFADRVATATADRRGAIRRELRLDDWRRWALTAGVALAAKLDVDRDALCDALDERVEAHCDRLVVEHGG